MTGTAMFSTHLVNWTAKAQLKIALLLAKVTTWSFTVSDLSWTGLTSWQVVNWAGSGCVNVAPSLARSARQADPSSAAIGGSGADGVGCAGSLTEGVGAGVSVTVGFGSGAGAGSGLGAGVLPASSFSLGSGAVSGDC